MKTCLHALALAALVSVAVADTTMTYSGNLPTAQAVLFPNASLLALQGMSLDIQNTFGTILRSYTISTFREPGETAEGIYLFENYGSVATAQFQWANGYNTTLSTAYFYRLKLRLAQVGDNIEGYVEKVVYNSSNKQYGVDITGMNTGGCTYKEQDLDTLANHNGFFTSCKNLVLSFAATGSHTVTFLDWDGTILDTQTVAYGGNATAPANPTRTNYVFAGWDTPFTAVTENLTVTALYHSSSASATPTTSLSLEPPTPTRLTATSRPNPDASPRQRLHDRPSRRLAYA